MGTLMWCLIGVIFLISSKAELHDYIPYSFHETSPSSSPSPITSQALQPDLIGRKEVVLLLTPDQVEFLQEAGAVVKPYPEYEAGFDELQQKIQQSVQPENIQQYQTTSRNESPKLGSKLENYYKYLNIQQINDDLAQPQTTVRTTTKITTTPRYKYIRQHDPKKVSQLKHTSEKTNSEYVDLLPNYENESLKIVPHDAQPLRPYQYDKVQENIYTQANDEVERNNHPKHRAWQNVKNQSNKEIQRHTYTRINQKPQRNEYNQRNNDYTDRPQPADEAQRKPVHKISAAIAKNLRNVYRQFNKNSQRNKQTQANKEARRNGYTKTIIEDQHYTHNQENDEAGRNSYKIDETQLNSYSGAIAETQQNLKAIEETQRIAHFASASVEDSQTYTRLTDGAQQNASYTPKNLKDQRNTTKAIEKVQTKSFKPDQKTIEEESKNPQKIIEVQTTNLKHNPASTSTYLLSKDTPESKETFKYVEGLQSSVQQQKKQETLISPPTVQTPIVNRDKLSLLLAPLYQHHAITDTIARQMKELSSDFKTQTRLQQIKHAPQHDHQEFTTELEKVTQSLGKHNTLAEIEATSNSPTVLINQGTKKIRPFEYLKNMFPILSSAFLRIQGPAEGNTSYPAPLEFIRPIPVPVLQTQNDAVEKASLSTYRNVFDKEALKEITLPEHVTVIRPIWEH